MILSVHTSPLARPGTQDAGGMNVYILNLSREWCKRGILVDIYTRSQDPLLPAVDYFTSGGRVIRIKAGPQAIIPKNTIHHYLTEFSQGVSERIEKESIRYDLIYGHYWLSGLVAIDLQRSWHLPVAVMFHTLGKIKNQVLQPDDQPEPQQRIEGEIKVMGAADLLVAPTFSEQQDMIELYGAEKNKIVIHPSGLDMTLFHPVAGKQARKVTGLSDARYVILFVGRIQWIKGIDLLLEALAIIRKQGPALYQDIALCMMGGDDSAPQEQMALDRFQTIAEGYGVAEQIKLLSARSQIELVDYYNAATLVVMPSRYESFGMVAVEALACGTPVIAADVGGLSVIIKDGVNGCLFPANDTQGLASKIIRLLEDQAVYQRLCSHARDSVARFSWVTIADNLSGSFRTIL